MSIQPISYAVIRGKVIETDLIEFGGRNGDLKFLAPNPATLARVLPLGAPSRLRDLAAVSVDEILEYLADLGQALTFEKNVHLQEALELTIHTAPTTPPLLINQYNRLPGLFGREQLEDVVHAIGRAHLDGWVEDKVFANGAKRYVRAFGARALHIIAGNSPMISALTTLVRVAGMYSIGQDVVEYLKAMAKPLFDKSYTRKWNPTFEYMAVEVQRLYTPGDPIHSTLPKLLALLKGKIPKAKWSDMASINNAHGFGIMYDPDFPREDVKI